MKTTSILAHESVKPHKARMHDKILAGLRRIKHGTSRQIAKACRLEHDQVWKRLSELRDQNIIAEYSTVKSEKTGRPVTVWIIIEQ